MKKIIIVRPDGIGDFILFSAVLEEYAKLYPEYKIDLLCQPKVRELVRPIPFINKVVCINTRKLFRKRYLLYTVLSLIKAKTLKYEKIIYPVYSRTRNDDLLISFIRAKEKIAFDSITSNDPNNERAKRNKYFTQVIKSEKVEKLEIDRNVEFIDRLGADVDSTNVKLKIWFTNEDERDFNRLQEKYDLKKNGNITIFPGAGDLIKNWQNKKWAKLIVLLQNNYPQYKIVIVGDKDDKLIIDAIINKSNNQYEKNVINLCKKTSLRILSKVIQNSKLFIGTDSCGAHIASAVNTPNICIMGGGHFGRFYPYGNLNINRIVYKKMDCFGCNWQCKYEEPKCIKEINFDDVWKKVTDFLD